MKQLNNLNIFGKYNPIIDEAIYIVFSLIICLIGLAFGLNLKLIFICFFAGILLDIDHFFNNILAKLISVKHYRKSICYGSYGYTFKIFHGVDMSILFSFLAFLFTSNILFTVLIFLNLCLHEVWDFLIYPHSWKELFLVTRILTKFNPGTRNVLKGVFFDIKTLKY